MHGSSHQVVGVMKLSGPVGQLIHVLEVLEEHHVLRAASMLRSICIATVPTPLLHFLYIMFPIMEWRALFAPDILGSRGSHLQSWQCMDKQKLQKAAEAAEGTTMQRQDVAAPDRERQEAAPEKCYYKHTWTQHDGPFRTIWMTKGKPKLRAVCQDCLTWLEGLQQDNYVAFSVVEDAE